MIRKLSAFLILAFIGWGYLQAQEAKTCFKEYAGFYMSVA